MTRKKKEKPVDYTVTINDGYTDYIYHFRSKSRIYSIEYLAGLFSGVTDLVRVDPYNSKKETSSWEK